MWKISDIECRAEDGGVFLIHWYKVKKIENHTPPLSFRFMGTTEVFPDPDSANFVAYEDLTEEIVLNWVFSVINKEAIEFFVDEKIQGKITGTITSGLPWKNDIPDNRV